MGDHVVGGRRLSRFALIPLVLATATVLGGCADLAKLFDPPDNPPAIAAVVKDLTGAQSSGDQLFAQLEQAPPACLYANTSGQFTAVAKLLDDASKQAAGVQTFEAGRNSIAALQKLVADSQHLSQGRQTCQPADLVDATKQSFDNNISSALSGANARQQEMNHGGH